MIDLTKIFDGIEKVAYDILIWILLVPKTLAQIVVDPAWVPGYVTKELGEHDENKFDDYLSPVILLLIASLLPYLIFVLTPLPSVVIDSNARIDEYFGEVQAGTWAGFWAIPDFIADTGDYTFEWDAQDGLFGATSGDYIDVVWDESGYQQIHVIASNDKGERLEAYYYVYVLGEGETPSAAAGGSSSSGSGSSPGFVKQLEDEGMILPTLLVLSLPMMFAIATEAFRGYPLMRSTLRRSFYIQCYYFAPIILGMWSVVLGLFYLVPPSEIWVSFVSIAVFGYLLLWLIKNETVLIHTERKPKVKIAAFGIVMACVALIGVMLYLMDRFSYDFELLRRFLESAYILIAGGLGLRWLVVRFMRKFKRKGTEANVPASEANVTASER